MRDKQVPRILVRVQAVPSTDQPYPYVQDLISRGIKAALPTATYVVANINYVAFSGMVRGARGARRVRYVYLTPRRAQRAMRAFDEGLPVPSFQFTLASGEVSR